MTPIPFRHRALLYLYGTPNIVGCLLALGGLTLFFTGAIQAYWWAIVAGLYGAGVAVWPRNELAQTAQHAQISTEHMAQQVRRLVDSVAKGLPDDAVDQLRGIEATLTQLLPQLQQMEDRGTISPKDSFTVLETVRRYLPDTLAAYLRLPKLYAQTQVVADRQTASQLLTTQLAVLKSSLEEIARNAFVGDAEKLITNGKFLQAKYTK